MSTDGEVLPQWIDEILAIEYGVELEDKEKSQIGESLWQKREHGSFDRFYSEVVEDSPEEILGPKHRAHSIANVGENKPWNCLGKAVYAAAVGEVAFGKEFDVVLEYGGEYDPGRDMFVNNRSHVFLKGSDGKKYGENGLYDRVEEHGTEVLPPLYLLSEAAFEQYRGNRDISRELTEEVDRFSLNSRYIDRKVEEAKELGY